MAVTRVPDTARLVLRVQDGVDSKGAPVLKNRTFRNLKAAALDDDVAAIGEALAGLQNNTLSAVVRYGEDILQKA